MIMSRLGASKRNGRAGSTIRENRMVGHAFLFARAVRACLVRFQTRTHTRQSSEEQLFFHTVTPMHRANEKETEHGIYPRIHP